MYIVEQLRHMMKLGIIGSSIWQQNLPLLERLTIPREEREVALPLLCQKLGISGLIYLATCNRVEFIYSAHTDSNPADLLHRLVDFFFRDGRKISFFPNDFYHYSGREAVNHLFRTVSSLDSLVVGETQITGQFKTALGDCAKLGILDELTEAAAAGALTTASRVKAETKIGNGQLSMASLAAKEVRCNLKAENSPTIALVGSGEMTRKVARYLQEAGFTRLLFVNRTVDRVRELATEFDGKALSLSEFLETPPPVHAIVSATASTEPVFGMNFQRARRRDGIPLLAVDLAIPRDFSEDFVNDDQVSYVDIPTLKSRGNKNLRRKFVETSRASEIVNKHVQRYISERIELSLRPIFRESHQESLRMARKAFADLFRKRVTTLDSAGEKAVLRLMTRLIGHTAYQPARLLSDQLGRRDEQIALSDPVVPQEDLIS